MNNNQIKIDSLDFIDIKENIRAFFKGQPEFSDYNFDGSVLSILIDILAYNTHYNAMYTNMALNEMFLDSASKYSSVVSHAKLLGYTPKSTISARQKINVSIFKNSNFSAGQFLPKGTIFNGVKDSRYYQFTVIDDVHSQGTDLAGSSGVHRFYDVPIIEGVIYNKTYIYSSDSEYFRIPQNKVDISTLKVVVYSHEGSQTFEEYVKADDLLNIRSDSRVFFIKQDEDLSYSIFFGDGKFGKQLQSGNAIAIEYVMSSGSLGNSVAEFTYQSGFSELFDRIDVITLESAWGGQEIEDIEQVRYNAPRSYSAADRAVTAEDYRNIVASNFPYIKDVTVWGGQNMNPPQFGKVFIQAKPVNARLLTYGQKEEIKNFLISKKAVISVNPEIIDPKICFIDIDSKIFYNKRFQRRQPGEIQSAVQRSVETFASSLGMFQSPFRHSKLIQMIDRSDQSITSNITRVNVSYQINPIFNKQVRYKLDTGNPIFKSPSSILSTNFYINDTADTRIQCFFRDDGLGNIDLYSVDNVKLRTIGEVNYQRGIIDIKMLSIKQISTPLEVRVIPLSNDVIPAIGYILEFRNANIQILEDSFNGDNSINPNFTFAASH